MEKSKLSQQKKSHKEWRKEAKKFRRKRIRQKLAKERDKILEEEDLKKQNDPEYQNWLRNQEDFELHQEEIERALQNEENKKWIEREELAQKIFEEERKRKKLIEQEEEENRLRIEKIFEKRRELIKKQKEEKKHQIEEKIRKQEIYMKKLTEYLDGGGSIPDELLENAETNPGKEVCLFFNKTGSCRFGDKCSRNHVRPGFSKILLIPHFFQHIRLEQSKCTEYGSDLVLEFTDNELYESYNSFFEDVVKELEKLGKIDCFRTALNCGSHLCGNVYVEYENQRDALRAFMKLQGRYYAGKRINVEFSGITSWKSAVCGLSLSKRCPKGRSCNYIHIFKNPQNKYALIKKYNNEKDKSWNNEIYEDNSRNWRWSESPETERIGISKNTIESDNKNKLSDKKYSKSSIDSRSKSESEENLKNSFRDSEKQKRKSEFNQHYHGKNHKTEYKKSRRHKRSRLSKHSDSDEGKSEHERKRKIKR